MNIFVTNKCPAISAMEHCDVHLRKMIVEVAQMLSTAHFVLDSVQVGYKPTHINHPCSVWIRQTTSNYNWAYAHFVALCGEYSNRFNKHHATFDKVVEVLSNPPQNAPQGDLQPFAMAMPDEYKKLGVYDQTKAYQAYLRDKFKEWGCRAKPIKVEWTHQNKPAWLEE